MNIEERLAVAIAALERIAENDGGPAYHIAKAAIEQIRESEQGDDD